jgi:Family of unknown function (DUF5681)
MSLPEPPKHTGGKFRKGISGNPRGKKRVAAASPAQPAPDTPDNAKPKQRRGGFQPGQSGNPAGMAKGTRHRATRLAEALFDGQAEALVQKAIQMALNGDQTALRLALERLCPPRRDRPVSIEMPKIEKASDLVAAAATITVNVAAGELTPQEGSDLVRLVEGTARAIEVHEFAERLAKLEQQMASKGNQ